MKGQMSSLGERVTRELLPLLLFIGAFMSIGAGLGLPPEILLIVTHAGILGWIFTLRKDHMSIQDIRFLAVPGLICFITFWSSFPSIVAEYDQAYHLQISNRILDRGSWEPYHQGIAYSFRPELLPGIAAVELAGSGEIYNIKNEDLTTLITDESNPLVFDLKNTELLETYSSDQSISGNNYLDLLILGFLGGLLALLTPCVFPMIPLTVSFFTNKDSNSNSSFNAILYGLFIVLIYLFLSVPFHFLESLDPEILNTISTNAVLNVLFFIIFIVFAFSFFGFYEITIPSSWVNSIDSKSNSIGGFIGIFFMAMTLVLVSFSCTGPILGSLLVGSISSQGGAMQLSVGMLGFGVALALPFTLFALFPNMLNSLPKSGRWMNTFKIILGFLELGFAFKFLSNADLVEHWGLIKREIFIGIWVIISILLSLYMLGTYKFPNESHVVKRSKFNVTLSLIFLCFAIYLSPALLPSGSNSARLLSGFTPPSFYSIYPKANDCPLGFNCFKDFNEGLEFAKEKNKPILLDFTGWACVNCRRIEENVWTDPNVYDLINENFVLISLYVDDRKELKLSDQLDLKYKSGKIKEIRTIGDKSATIQALNFKSASQPYYVLLDPNLKILNSPIQYTSKEVYQNWLEEGLRKFK